MNLVCLGERRFRLLRKLRETPYLVGEVEPLDSTDAEGDDVAELANFVGSRLAVSLWTKQRLLEELSVRRQLEAELEVLSDAIREMTPKVDVARAQRWRALGVMN